ncbi:bacterio-opsin activator domain-containing protein [Natronococcus sp. A-GB7]|uniref:bacterio-opsin activator domain-containing protein n=1 Tax=Natronococcus sp. A-GB7 TaxID=3037649 RepID=UPI00241EB699|nr:bacterio-opsin activator domain-containing protein [Natronococcus sp. A-GB7]MDG5817441.1 bacterio-opsin activator domain-containing protein [Natronococcus sp. A-GB7]
MTGARTLLVRSEDGVDRAAGALEDAGCRVTAVDSATRALAVLSSEGFDCLVSEQSLSGDDGLSLFDAVREVEPELPFVMYADGEVAEDAFEAGVDRFVAKNGDGSQEELAGEVAAVTSATEVVERDVSDHEPAPEEIVRAIDDASVGITMTDPSLPDNPIVYINDAWEEITGYAREEILGRNPRFLQGPGTDPEARKTLSVALDREEPTTVELKNYRSDGTPWWNELTVAPIHDEDGELVHYVGFQKDVTDRKTAERLAEERAEKLVDEKEALERILTRVNGVLSEITRVLVEENDRPIVEQRICDELVDAEGYVAAWIGSVDSVGETLELTGTAGLESETGSRSLADLPDAVSRAVETNEIARQSVRECDAETFDVAAVGACRIAVVPLVYGHKRYGLLGVYGDSESALDAREGRLFDSIGAMIGTRFNAIEISKVLTADRVVEVTVSIADPSFPLSAVAAAVNGEVEYVGMTSAGEETELFVTIRCEGAVPDLATLSYVEDVREVARTDDVHTLALAVDVATPFDELADYGASVSRVTANPTRARVVVDLPLKYDVRAVLELLESLYDGVELRSQVEHDRRERTSEEFASDLEQRLTDRQQVSLETAHMNGYFEWPRPTDGDEIADTMDITRQTFHQHLRAAERKLVDTYVDSWSNGR